MIDFSKIRSFSSGQRNSFEELVCQLGRREKFTNGSIFKRVEGAGGDGGIEAYWTKPNARKTGYQAKYFLKTGDIDWSQIDKSVTQALATHPELELFVVAFPCDLTDRSGVKRQGKTGWEHWESRVKKWKEQAKLSGISDIEFQVWPSSELVNRLSTKEASGLREFFFGEVVLSDKWFQDKIVESVALLGERYHPEDHVDIRIEKLFSVISRTHSCKQELLDTLCEIECTNSPEKTLSKLENPPDKKAIAEIHHKKVALLAIQKEITFDPQHNWNTSSWLNLARELRSATDQIKNWCWEYERTLDKDNPERYQISLIQREISALQDYVNQLVSMLRTRYFEAEQEGLAFIRGNAGTGKSHLFAKSAECAINNKNPAVLLLGQRFNDSDLWVQISHNLGLPGRSSEQILGALDAVGKASGVRTLLLIDAINEGVGSRFWRDRIASLIHKIKDYSHVCCVISCRAEYFDLAVPDSMSKAFPVFDIRGFETPEEQLNAARVYLDRRGIARPSTPWLSPEFVNPLFLRSVCTSLQKDNKSEFPAGINGSRKILVFYLKSIGSNIRLAEECSIDLTPKIGRTAKELAGKMLDLKVDFLEIDRCQNIIRTQFEDYRPRTAPDWLSVFLNNGILRKDPNPTTDAFSDEDVIRFSFQRFQDYLMAEAALEKIETTVGLFDEKGLLGFCIEDDFLSWDWRGLADALAVALPEKFGVELVDALPGDWEKWWSNHYLHEIFEESVKWRDRGAFSDRTLELLNDFRFHFPDPFEILIQVAVSAEHPWNAELLHRNLISEKLPDRDAFWTLWLNKQEADEESHVGILVEWCLNGQVKETNQENQFLAAIVLCWLFSSTNRAIRDKATKALTNIFMVREGIFPMLLNRFYDIDDLYILERLLAAAFSSCCLRTETTRMINYSQEVYKLLFKDNSPPQGILLRDYAYGIIELASFYSVLPASVDLEKCKPPYKSPKMRLNITEEQLKKIAETAGGDQILNSATGFMGDFAQYEIASSVSDFLKTPLTQKVKLTKQQKSEVFENDIVSKTTARVNAFNVLKESVNPYSYGILSYSLDSDCEEPSKEQIEMWYTDIKESEEAFLELLNKMEVKQFHSECSPYLYEKSNKDDGPNKFDLNAIKRWVANRAYKYGWTEKRFGQDNMQHGDYSRDRPRVERIGKKYQWLAFDEILCRLADNYWMQGEYGNPPKYYRSPIDIGFRRDIDPTVLEYKECEPLVSQELKGWPFKPMVKLQEVSEKELHLWPFEKDPAKGLKSLPIRTDDEGVDWIVLYEYQSQREKYVGGTFREHDFRIQEFRFLATVMVRASEVSSIARKFESDGFSRGITWAVPEVTDTAFLHEAPWRDTWGLGKWKSNSYDLPAGTAFAPMVSCYAWESHLDSSLPDGYSSYLPSPWLARELKVFTDSARRGLWFNDDGEVICREVRDEDGRKIFVLRIDKFEELVGDEFTLLSILIAERNAWPGGGNSNAAWRRSEGVCWKDGAKFYSKKWTKDTSKSGKKSKN